MKMDLEALPLLRNYVVVDDENLLQAFSGHAVYCRHDWLDDEFTGQTKDLFSAMRLERKRNSNDTGDFN